MSVSRAIKIGGVAIFFSLGTIDCNAQEINDRIWEHGWKDKGTTWSMRPVEEEVTWSIGNVQTFHDLPLDMGHYGNLRIISSRNMGDPTSPYATGYLIYYNDTDDPGGGGPWYSLTHLGQFAWISDVRTQGDSLVEIDFWFHQQMMRGGHSRMKINCSHFRQLSDMAHVPADFQTEFSIHSLRPEKN